MTDTELEPEFVDTAVSPDVGTDVFVVYWLPRPMPGDQQNGTWEITPARVISIGRDMACLEVDNPSVMSMGSVYGSSLRFVELSRVFGSFLAAERTAKQLKPPVG